MSKPNMVRVIWRDSMVLAQGGWFDPEDAPFPTGKELRHESAGFLVSDTDEGVVVAASIYEGNDEGLRVATAVFIPRSAIIDVWPLNG
jgi:hypothetical protein